MTSSKSLGKPKQSRLPKQPSACGGFSLWNLLHLWKWIMNNKYWKGWAIEKVLPFRKGYFGVSIHSTSVPYKCLKSQKKYHQKSNDEHNLFWLQKPSLECKPNSYTWRKIVTKHILWYLNCFDVYRVYLQDPRCWEDIAWEDEWVNHG